MPYVVSHTSGKPPIPSNRLPNFAPSPMYDFIFGQSRTTAEVRCCFPVPYNAGCLPPCAFSLWCPSTLQCPSIHPGSPATAHILSVSACGQSILFSVQQVPPAGSRPLILWTEVLGMCHLRHIPAAPTLNSPYQKAVELVFQRDSCCFIHRSFPPLNPSPGLHCSSHKPC